MDEALERRYFILFTKRERTATSLDVGVNLADLSKIGKRLLIAGIIIMIIIF